MKLDLSAYLNPNFVPPQAPIKAPAEPEVPMLPEQLSHAEEVVLHTVETSCACGVKVTTADDPPLTTHTLLKRRGFGYVPVGKVYLPLYDLTMYPGVPRRLMTSTRSVRACASCFLPRPPESTSSVPPPIGTSDAALAQWNALYPVEKRLSQEEKDRLLNRSLYKDQSAEPFTFDAFLKGQETVDDSETD